MFGTLLHTAGEIPSSFYFIYCGGNFVLAGVAFGNGRGTLCDLNKKLLQWFHIVSQWQFLPFFYTKNSTLPMPTVAILYTGYLGKGWRAACVTL